MDVRRIADRPTRAPQALPSPRPPIRRRGRSGQHRHRNALHGKKRPMRGRRPARRRSDPGPIPRRHRRTPTARNGTAPIPTEHRRPMSSRSTDPRPIDRRCMAPNQAPHRKASTRARTVGSRATHHTHQVRRRRTRRAARNAHWPRAGDDPCDRNSNGPTHRRRVRHRLPPADYRRPPERLPRRSRGRPPRRPQASWRRFHHDA